MLGKKSIKENVLPINYIFIYNKQMYKYNK